MNWPIVFQGLGLLIAMTTLALTILKFANRKAAALEQAQNALALMKALREQAEAETDPIKLRTSKGLQEKLLERSLYASQLYVQRTDPILVNYAQVALIGIFTLGYYLYFSSNPIVGIPEEISAVGAGALLILGGGATWWATTLVMTHQANTKQLQKGILIIPTEKRGRISWRKIRREALARTKRWQVKDKG